MSKNNLLRREEIQTILVNEKEVGVHELAKKLRVSLETIRGDLRYLDAKGILYRTHGGAKLRTTNVDVPMSIRQQENIIEKRKIAREILPFINDDDVIYIDTNSTALYLGTLLKIKNNITIVTNSFEMVSALSNSNHKVIVVGGEYLSSGKRVVGQYALKVIESIYFDVCILGMDGCKNVNGPANMLTDEMLMDQRVLSRSRKSILVSDASKFEQVAHYQYADFSQFDLLITTKLKTEDRLRVPINDIIEIEEER